MAKKNKRTTIQEIKDEYEVLNKYYEIYEIVEKKNQLTIGVMITFFSN